MQFLVGLFLFLMTGLALAQSTVTLQPSGDNWIIYSSGANTNKGGLTELDLRDTNTDSGLIRFNIFQTEGGPVPNGATITSATLSLVKLWGPDAVFKANRLLKNWVEMQSTWNVAATGVPWTTVGALGSGTDIVATADGQGSIGDAVATGCSTVPNSGPFPAACWLNIDVTAGVQAFSSGTANYGWRLSQVSSSNVSAYKNFNSKEFSNAAGRPKLTVTYTTGGGGGTGTCPTGSSRPYESAPINGNAISIASSGTTSWEAEYFNCGAEGSAFHDTVAGVNAGQTFRADNEVEITDVLVNGSPSGNLAVNHFDNTEWIEWSINVNVSALYSFGLKASNSPSSGGSGIARILIDGVAVGSDITVTQGADWEDYRWFDTSTMVNLGAGPHKVRLYSQQQSFRVDQMRATLGGVPGGGGGGGSGTDDCTRSGLDLCVRFEANPDTQRQGIDFACSGSDCSNVRATSVGGNLLTFNALNKGSSGPCTADCANDTSRLNIPASPASGGDGSTALQLRTVPGDTGVHSSGDWERSQLNLESGTGTGEGVEQWWSHAMLFPVGESAFVTSEGNAINPFQWHHNGNCSAPNIIVDIYNQDGSRPGPVIRAFGAGGSCESVQYTWTPPGSGTKSGQCIHDPLQRGVWYEFVHHIVWSSTGNGTHEIWMREGPTGTVKKVLQKTGINTLYSGDSAYLSLTNYHPASGSAISVYHDRIRRSSLSGSAGFNAVAPPNFTMTTTLVPCPGAQ